ncbi:hypothetical protein [Microcoleus asticus]|uniref:Uncharacterized protein n=1 Tax=Microcoleus asticus IPMA8 TaxID=2563858 RepID=A0ABX2D603_9CYAN|nr:hypothetical protein [Microcoleus asticus]NQE38077.1 hypothetical protein [Microcoleus asticus IPMA8]
MPQPPATTEPPGPAATHRRLTNRATETRIPPTVRSVAGRLTHFDRKIQQHPDSIKRTADYLGARKKVEPLHCSE